MKLKRKARKLTKINYDFIGFTTFEKEWWYNHDLKTWMSKPMFGEYLFSTSQPCHSIRAFRRKLKKAPYGVKFTLMSRYKGQDVYGVGSNKLI